VKLLVNAISAKQGGIVTYTQNMVRWMRDNRIDATFAVPENFAADGKNFLRVKASNYTGGLRFIWEQTMWRAIVNSQSPDVLYSSANFGLFLSPVPQVLLIREGGLFDPIYLANFAPAQGPKMAVMRSGRRRLMLQSAKWATQVITPSTAMRDLLLLWQPKLSTKIEVCSYGTRNELFSPRDMGRPWRAGGTLKLIYVSVYYPHKNPGIVCEVVRNLNRGDFPALATITMDMEEIRRTPGGALDAYLVQRASQDGQVALGHRPYEDLPALYAGHDVFVFPSVSESFGHPMAEAMATGLPVVAADTRVNREICHDGAVYFKPFSATDLEARLRELDARPDLRRDLVMRGRRRADTLYRWDDHMTRLMSIFERITTPSRTSGRG
jgi:glycosyltransferase involved in cell wall biosynthesis